MTTIGKPRIRVPAVMADGMASVVSALGTSKDKMSSLYYTHKFLDDQQLFAAYRGDWVARKAVDIPAKDGTREWRSWQAEDGQIELIEAEEKRLGVQAKTQQAWVKARLLGGAAILVGDGSPNPAAPIDHERVGKGGIKYLHVMSRIELQAGEMDRDLASPYFGQPSVYRLNTKDGAQIDIHPSRVIRFIGNPLPDEWGAFDRMSLGWGDSVLLAVDDALKQAGLVMGGIATLVNEAKVDIVKIKDMTANLAMSDYEAALVKRFAVANALKSIINSVVMDSEEEWDTRQINFGGLPDMVKTYLMVASAAVDIPATRFLGQSPTGLSSTGESDTRNYYDRVASDQKNDIGPRLAPLDEMIIRSALGSRPPEIHYTWRPLWQISEMERATIAKTKAEAVQIYASNGLVNEDALATAVQNMLVEDGLLPGLEAAIAEAGEIDEDDPEVREAFGREDDVS